MASVIALDDARLRRRTKPAEPAARTKARPRPAAVDAVGGGDATRLGILAAGFVAFGIIMVLSASSVVSVADYGSPWALVERQVMWSVLGLVALGIGLRIDLRRLRRLAVPFLIGTALLLLAVLAPGIGKVAGGSSRWIGAGPIRIQPSEFAKLAFAMFAADLIARRIGTREQSRDLVRPVIVVLAFLGILILKQPDLGTAIVLVCIAAATLYTAGVERRLLVGWLGVVALVGTVVAMSASYRRDRLFSFVNPFAHASTTGYQVVQSLVALGSGHLTGTGIGGSAATWGFLPNVQTDFIFAVIGNELGMAGAVAVLLAFAAFGWLGIRIAARATDRFTSLLAAAITCWVVFQALINIGGVLGVLPETGIPLPFLSFGGSSLVVVLLATGLLMNIGRHPSVATGAAERPRPARPRPRPRASTRAS